MKKLLASSAAAALLAGATAAHAEFSGNVALSTDYLFYGASQTSEGWAISGGLTYEHEPTGFYLGTWSSSIDFNGGATDPANIELDGFAGIAGEFANGLSWDLGVWYYGYPDQNEDVTGGYDYFELYAKFSYTFAGSLEPTLGFGVNVSPEFFGETGTSYYPNASLKLKLPQQFGFYVSYGFLTVARRASMAYPGLDYGHYSVGVTKSVMGLDFDLSYNDADNECGRSLCRGVVFKVSKSF
ncbi:MAG: hypothetical protein IT494_00250 [Gammaproteobacteria bacterium]|nr:hypothetical protein [Gammaproteobacteria bacterium]